MRNCFSPTFTRKPLPSPADIRRGETTAATVMEIVSFRLVAGGSEAALLAAARATESLIAAQPGFVRRRLTLGADGSWCDLIEWQSLSQALAAAGVLTADPVFAPFMAAIDLPSARMQHLTVISQIGD